MQPLRTRAYGAQSARLQSVHQGSLCSQAGRAGTPSAWHAVLMVESLGTPLVFWVERKSDTGIIHFMSDKKAKNALKVLNALGDDLDEAFKRRDRLKKMGVPSLKGRFAAYFTNAGAPDASGLLFWFASETRRAIGVNLITHGLGVPGAPWLGDFDDVCKSNLPALASLRNQYYQAEGIHIIHHAGQPIEPELRVSFSEWLSRTHWLGLER